MFAIAEPIPYGKDALPACDQNFRGPVKATGLRSLEQLLDINVEHYVLIGEAFSRIDRVFDGGIFSSMKIPPDPVDFLRNLLPGLATHCQALELQVTGNLISDFKFWISGFFPNT